MISIVRSAIEEQRAGITDMAHFAYPTYARAARTRRTNLLHSADELKGQLDEAKLHLEEALGELAKEQNLEVREKVSDRLTDLAVRTSPPGPCAPRKPETPRRHRSRSVIAGDDASAAANLNLCLTDKLSCERHIRSLRISEAFVAKDSVARLPAAPQCFEQCCKAL